MAWRRLGPGDLPLQLRPYLCQMSWQMCCTDGLPGKRHRIPEVSSNGAVVSIPQAFPSSQRRSPFPLLSSFFHINRVTFLMAVRVRVRVFAVGPIYRLSRTTFSTWWSRSVSPPLAKEFSTVPFKVPVPLPSHPQESATMEHSCVCGLEVCFRA